MKGNIMSNLNKYLLHDTYRVTRNLSLLDIAPKEEVVKHVVVAGKHSGREYTEEEVYSALNHLVQIGMLKMVNGEYEVL